MAAAAAAAGRQLYTSYDDNDDTYYDRDGHGTTTFSDGGYDTTSFASSPGEARGGGGASRHPHHPQHSQQQQQQQRQQYDNAALQYGTYSDEEAAGDRSRLSASGTIGGVAPGWSTHPAPAPGGGRAGGSRGGGPSNYGAGGGGGDPFQYSRDSDLSEEFFPAQVCMCVGLCVCVLRSTRKHNTRGLRVVCVKKGAQGKHDA